MPDILLNSAVVVKIYSLIWNICLAMNLEIVFYKLEIRLEARLLELEARIFLESKARARPELDKGELDKARSSKILSSYRP